MTSGEAAVLLRCSLSHVRSLVRRGLLRASRTSARGKYRFRSEDVEKLTHGMDPVENPGAQAPELQAGDGRWSGALDGGSAMAELNDDDDPVEPKHYKDLSPPPVDVVEAWGLGFCLGNVLKYIARAGRKPGASDVEDLRKAAWYLNREIERRRGADAGA